MAVKPVKTNLSISLKQDQKIGAQHLRISRLQKNYIIIVLCHYHCPDKSINMLIQYTAHFGFLVSIQQEINWNYLVCLCQCPSSFYVCERQVRFCVYYNYNVCIQVFTSFGKPKYSFTEPN